VTRRQRTLNAGTALSGAGLHEGRPARVRLLPAAPGTGVCFARTDLPGAPTVTAAPEFVAADAGRRTQLRRGAAEVHTVEHLLAALTVARVDNVRVELDGPELPGLDGSARPWAEALAAAGAVEQEAERAELRLRRAVAVELDGASLAAIPTGRAALELCYTLDYRKAGVPAQYVEAALPGTDIAAEILPARTFVLASEVDALRAAGLGRGADLSNTVVLEPGGGARGGSLRFPDEPARHKMLDLLGDLSLLGVDLCARVVAVKSGHRAHHELVRRLQRELEPSRAEAR
jgi:UDP-3-O-acyl N-acetylglucosamine deacetylase